MGQKQAAYDTNGIIVAFYDTLDSPAPDGADVITIADAQWLICVNEPGQWYVKNGVLEQVPQPSAADQLAAAKSSAIAALNATCQTAILAGFTSSALGTETFYPTTETDQRNLQSSALAASWSAGSADWNVPLWCRQGKVWAYAKHTAQQVRQANADWVAFRTASQQKYADAIAQVREATTIDAVNAIAAKA